MKISEYAKEGRIEPESIPDLFLPYQKRWLSDISGIKLWTKSRRIGATWCDAAGAAIEAARENGSNHYYLGYEKDMARGYIEYVSDWAKALQATCSEIDGNEQIFRDENEEYSIFIFRVYFNSGHIVEALSSKARALRSRQGNVSIDEAAFVDDLPGLLKAARALRLLGGKISIITTYNGIENDYHELERDVISGKFPYSLHRTTFDDAISQGLYERLCLINGLKHSKEAEAEWRRGILAEFGEDADEELMCIPKNSGGAYFSRILIESCMSSAASVLRLTLDNSFILLSEESQHNEISTWLNSHCAEILEGANQNWNSYYGMDFARSGDLSYLAVAQEDDKLIRRTLLALELRNIPFDRQRQILFWLVDRLPRFTKGAHDSRGNGQYLAEVAALRYRGKVAAVMATDNWYREYFAKYKAGLEDKKVVLPQNADLLQDHRQVVMVRGTPKVPDSRKKGSDGKERHGDGAIACCLMWFASEQDTIIIEPDFGIV